MKQMLTRNLDKARKAYRTRDKAASRRAHDGEYGPQEHHDLGTGQYLKSVIYGGLDGIVTTFAVVTGVQGADLASGIVLVLGFANLFADGISMAVGDYLSTKAELEYAAAERKREEWEVEHYPEGEAKEMEEIYVKKGMSSEDARKIVRVLTRNKKAWVDAMMKEELGIIDEAQSPFKNALATFFSFGVFGFMPLLTYVLARFIPFFAENTFVTAAILTACTLFTLGALKVYIVDRTWYAAGLEMLLVGGIAACAAYIVGALLGGLA